MKTSPCPWCGEQPDTLGLVGIHITSCLGCTPTRGPHGQPGRTMSDSKKAWNEFVASGKWRAFTYQIEDALDMARGGPAGGEGGF